MTIKNMMMAGLVCCGLTAAFTSCSKDTEAFYTVSEDDAPRILNDDLNSSYEVTRSENFVLDILVTPADMTTIKWYDGDRLVAEGRTLNRLFEAGDYNMRIVATTVKGKETYRTFNLTVKPIDGDPVATSTAIAERMVKAGQPVKLHGSNLSDIQKVSINGRELDATYNAEESCVEYTVPADVPNGTYRVSLKDSNNQLYGAGKQSVVTKPTFSKTTISGLLNGGSLDLEGALLDQVASVVIDGKECPVTAKSDGKLTITVPAMQEGTYSFKATTVSGETAQFYNDGELAAEGLYRISSEIDLLEGNFVIDWDAAICHLNPDVLETIPVGATIRIYYDVPAAEYHNLRIITSWWNDVPGGAQIDVTNETPNPFELQYTQEFKNQVLEQGGMSCVGFGYTVKRISYK